MKLPSFFLVLTTACALGQAATQAPRHESLKQELRLSVERGLNFLRSTQNKQTGQWGEAEPVAMTGLAIASFMLDPNRKPGDAVPAEVEAGTRYLLTNAKPDGSITIKARATYNTAIALTALMLNPKPENEEVMLKARRYLVTRQLDLDEKGKNDAPTDGGIGYGEEKATHADLSNTTFALEALYYAQSLLADKGDAAKNEPQLNYAAAIDFIQRCQNRPESNKSSWVSKDPADAGGFIYNPTETRGAKVELPDGRVALRSYGSISYAGLLSFIYAGLDKKDDRVKAVLEWLRNNSPNLVITDINMPRMDGFGLIEALRGESRWDSTPILVLTTESSDDKKSRARNAGATGWIVKPFDPEKLASAVRRVIH